MALKVSDNPVLEPGTYEPVCLADIDTFDGTDHKGETFTSLKWTFDLKNSSPEAELIIFTSTMINPRSRAGEIVSGIMDRPLQNKEEIDEQALYEVPLSLIVGKRTKKSGSETNTLTGIKRLGDKPAPVSNEPDYNDIPF